MAEGYRGFALLSSNLIFRDEICFLRSAFAKVMRKRKANQISNPTAIGMAEATSPRAELPEMSAARRNSALNEIEKMKISFAVFAAYRRLYFPAVKIFTPFLYDILSYRGGICNMCGDFYPTHIILKRNKKQKALILKAFARLPRKITTA